MFDLVFIEPMAVDINVHHSTYDERSSEFGFGGTLKHDDYPIYLSLSQDNADIDLLGQNMTESDMFSVGLGFKAPLAGGWELFIEGGYVFLDSEYSEFNTNEIAYTYLVGRHAVGERQIPVTGPGYNGNDYGSSYEVDDGYYAKMGVAYFWEDTIGITFSYKAFRPDFEIAIWDEERRAAGRGYWREGDEVDLSAVEVGIVFRF